MTKITRKVAASCGMMTAVIGLLWLVYNAFYQPPAVRAMARSAPRGPESQAIAAMRQSGLAEDHSQIPTLIAALHTPSVSDAQYAALHSLAQMGAEEALPDFDPLIRKTIMDTRLDPELSNFAQAARARLVAESAAKNMPPGQARAQAKMDKLLDEAGVSISDLNAAPTAHGPSNLRPASLYALRELADMIYQKRDTALAQYAQAQGVQFGSQSDSLLITSPAMIPSKDDDSRLKVDVATAVKVKLAPLSDQQRLTWLVDNLAQIYVMDGDAPFVIQLAVDQGLPASQAAAAKLKDMQAHPNQYQNQCGYTAMFYIISGVGDKQQLPLIEQFVNAPMTDQLSRDKHHDASIALRRLQEGTAPTYPAGY